MVGGKFLGIVRGLGNERLFVTNLALYVVDLWNEKNMGVFASTQYFTKMSKEMKDQFKQMRYS